MRRDCFASSRRKRKRNGNWRIFRFVTSCASVQKNACRVVLDGFRPPKRVRATETFTWRCVWFVTTPQNNQPRDYHHRVPHVAHVSPTCNTSVRSSTKNSQRRTFQLPRQPSPRVRTPGDARARTVSGYHDYHPYDVLVKANGFVRRSRSVVPRETGGRVRRNETSRYTCKISRNNDDVWMGACRDVRDLN